MIPDTADELIAEIDAARERRAQQLLAALDQLDHAQLDAIIGDVFDISE